MTVASEVARVSYPGTGSAGPFTIPFRFFSFDDLTVIVRSVIGTEVELVEGADYTGTGERNASGTLTLTTTLATGELLTILRDPAKTQTSSFRNQSSYFGSSHEEALDRLAMQVQALQDQVNSAVRLQRSSDPATHSLELVPETGKVLAWGSSSLLTNSTLDSSADVALPGNERTTDTLTELLANNTVYNVLDYGAVNDGDPSKAAANSAAIQKVVDKVKAHGGGVVWFPASRGVVPLEYCTDAPIRVPAGVHIIGEDRYTTIVKKVTATASTQNDTTAPVYQFPTQVGFPVCVFHFFESAGVGYSYGTVANITVAGNTTDPNTTAVGYGFFFNGMSEATVEYCLARYCKVGFFWGGAATIMSQIVGNITNWCQRGFYQHFMTGTGYHSNYAVLSRYIGHDLSAYYSDISANGCDSGGKAGSGRAASTEMFYAYKLYACRGVTFHGNGAESNNGTPLWLFGNVSLGVRNNTFLDITSDHTASNLYALDMDSNYDITVEDNRFVWATTKLSGSAIAGTHFNWRVVSQHGYHIFRRNRFVDVYTDVADTGWTNTSGAVAHVAGIDDQYNEVDFTPGATFDTPGNVAVTYGGSNAGKATLRGNICRVDIDLDISTMTFTTAAGALRITGLPYVAALGPPGSGSFTFVSANLTYPTSRTHITPSVVSGTQYLVIAAHQSAVSSSNVAVGQLVSGAGLRIQLTAEYRVA